MSQAPTDDTRLLARVLRSTAAVMLGSGAAKACLVAVEFYLAIVLGAAGYGLFSIAFAFLLVVSTLAQAGFNFGTVQYLSLYAEAGDADGRRSVVRASLLFVLLVSTAIGAAVFAGAGALAALFRKPELAPLLTVIAFIIPLESLNQCLSAVFRGLRQFRWHVVVLDLARNVVMLAMVPLVLLDGVDVVPVLEVAAAGTAAGTALGLAALFRQFDLLRGFDRDRAVFLQLFSFSYLLFIWQVLQKSANRLTLLIAGAVLSAADVGVLAVVTRFLNVLGFPQTVIGATTPVEFARFHQLDDRAGLNRLFQAVTLALLTVSLALTVPLVLHATPVMSLFGADYAPYGWVLVALLAAKAVDVGTGPAVQVLVAGHRRKSVLALSAFDAVLQFLAVVPLMMVLGMAGAVYGNAARTVLVVAARHVALHRLLGVRAITRPLVLLLAGGVAACAGGAALLRFADGIAWQAGATLLVLLAMAVVVVAVLRGEPHLRQAVSELMRGRGRRSRNRPADGAAADLDD